ncbi:uncharacterized protein KY384_005448 [Bacidia gigantensis]|uniref:uncharacterized protein n=1 Tax=Bacidia gigantensis TaxID=2732470 RepID=UPI001D043230|nr:uncharacterized protein KY384_005448 [Bacidia gigantensis]KAG8529966.1 hypothetical protein KY384_005448 [Bacidia gigantensis]
MSRSSGASVETYTSLFQELLKQAQELKPVEAIDPALKAEDFGDNVGKVGALTKNTGTKGYAAIETAARNLFYGLLVGSFFSSAVFVSKKHFKQKSLIILRACNELLRRLSRAEDTVFCGRVFIFLFQSFPLGDRSSVNLRGEYHVENVTTYEKVEFRGEAVEGEEMAIDTGHPAQEALELREEASSRPVASAVNEVDIQNPSGTQTVKLDSKNSSSSNELPDMDALYSIFWSLQDYFSQPARLFEPDNLKAFKSGLQATIVKFKQVQQDQLARGTSKLPIERQRSSKRKRSGQEEELASAFNPKYLTSRDLFDLEISDLSFRRHVLVQALILIDFLLSLTPKAKKKLEHTTNKSVLYSLTLSDEDAEWALGTRNDIAAYLQQGPEGKFYYRMVDTVLSRDKNWVHWKAENCPPIARDPVSAENFAEAEKMAQKTCAPKRLRPAAMGALDLAFLTENKGTDGMEKLKDPTRYSIPPIDGFKASIAEDDFDVEMAKSSGEQTEAKERRASKLWRTLRIASKSRLNVFEKIEDGKNLKPLFEPENEMQEQVEGNGSEANGETLAKLDAPEEQPKQSDQNTTEMEQENAIK